VVRLLLEKGADIEAKTNGYGWTALYRASGGGHEAVVRLLLEKGADVKTKTEYRWTAVPRVSGGTPLYLTIIPNSPP
jgi:ankyrin repeat protein